MNSSPDPTHFRASALCSDAGTDLKQLSTAESSPCQHETKINDHKTATYMFIHVSVVYSMYIEAVRSGSHFSVS